MHIHLASSLRFLHVPLLSGHSGKSAQKLRAGVTVGGTTVGGVAVTPVGGVGVMTVGVFISVKPKICL